MQAIAHFVVERKPAAKIIYATSEDFTNKLINSIRDDRMASFRNKYRNIDLLLVDDIQFLAGKERTQEEFFHTFNALYEAGKQLVLSSDRPPKEIPTLEERLRSRFEGGLTADIQAPDFETRIAILKKKAEIAELTVPDEVLVLIASKIFSNIRELEGALIRIVAYASLAGSEISPAMANQVLKDILAPAKEKPSLSIDLIKKIAAEYYSVKIDDMSAKIRTREIATARQVAMYLARVLTSASLPKIGEEFGGRDHTTVLYACAKIKEAIKDDREVDEAVKTIIENLRKYA
jgi:chromosomal replication initiator protein